MIASHQTVETTSPIFSHEMWHELLEASFGQIRQLSALKGGEYSGDFDRLANFRRNAERLGLDYRQIWAVYAAKHWDAILQYVADIASGKERQRLEGIEGRVDDLLVYLLLFKAMLREQDVLLTEKHFGQQPLGSFGSTAEPSVETASAEISLLGLCSLPFFQQKEVLENKNVFIYADFQELTPAQQQKVEDMLTKHGWKKDLNLTTEKHFWRKN